MADCDVIKRKIRQLKKIEAKIRFGSTVININALPAGSALVWDFFFDLKLSVKSKAKYNINALAAMDKEAFLSVIDEFFFTVYYQFYKESGMTSVPAYDPGALSQMGLPHDADYSAIKKKFRELALKYHPDVGGDAEKFIELMANYKKLTGGIYNHKSK